MTRIKLAVQKSGRLSEKTKRLLNACGIDFQVEKGRLVNSCENFPMDILFVRDDDIPNYVAEGTCDIGVVGFNELSERAYSQLKNGQMEIAEKLGFGKCRLSIAVKNGEAVETVSDLDGKRIATSYPEVLGRFLSGNGVDAKIVEIQGSVEIAPSLGVSDAICDLVSTGATLAANELVEKFSILQSEACLVKNSDIDLTRQTLIEALCLRIRGVLKAESSKYIMMNAPKTAVEKITEVISGLEKPTVMPLMGDDDKVAIHVVARETVFWETIESLKEAGASSVLVVPIEKILD